MTLLENNASGRQRKGEYPPAVWGTRSIEDRGGAGETGLNRDHSVRGFSARLKIVPFYKTIAGLRSSRSRFDQSDLIIELTASRGGDGVRWIGSGPRDVGGWSVGGWNFAIEQAQKHGELGAVVKVKNGFARNFLIPHGKAKRATESNIAEFEKRRAELEKAQSESLILAL